ncbi:hypothetical protein BGW38_004716 [Lunasporangiospora selenospora]|uniref:Uncharacterized protein n=1 Tax=Lunasporangiospora selenospora TaxID=979761 RepID=A0A9P6G402_9FUNG|nr:hypothetical protein BGW38_004716 [Lunasporangiospora selenospora]
MNPGNSKNTSQPGNALSSIVSSLVRAAIGGKNHDVRDEDLDKYVADMIMKSATDADKRYKSIGLKAYTSEGTSSHLDDENKVELAPGVIVDRVDSNGLKTNKRFLSSLLRSTDQHNQALIRAEEERATEIAKELIAKKATKAISIQVKILLVFSVGVEITVEILIP